MKCFQKKLCHIGLVMDAILVNSYIIAATLAGISLVMVAPRLMAGEVEANLIQILETSNFPAPDTAGIVYLPSQDAFLVSDSEINEMTIFQGGNVFKVDRNGSLLETFSTISFSNEPTGVTINPLNNHCFFSDDNSGSIYEIDPGDDGLCLTADDTVTSFATDNNFGSLDPEDVTYGLESLFISDGVNNRVYRISGNNGVFDNVTEENLVNSFDTQSLGVTDPEGIVFDSTNDTLFIVGPHEQLIIQTTTYGTLLHTIDISAINPNRPSGLALAPSSEDPTMINLYMVVRGEDNNSDPNENDGAIYELAIPTITSPVNSMPVVSAGENQSITLPANALLNGSVSDDGMPDGTLSTTWSKQSGPGEVSFTDPDNPNTTASFSATGTYVLRLTGYDGELYSFDDLSIVVSNNIPVITLNGTNPMTFNIGDTFTDPGATAMDDADGDLTAFIQTTSNVDTAVVGIYQITYMVNDSDGYSASVNRRVVVSDGIYFLQNRVSASTDDAEENPDGRMYITSSDLDLVVDKQVQTVGIRFSNLSIPTNAIITKAYIQFKSDETDFFLDTLLNIAAESTDNALSFDNTQYNISSRTKTNASISWSPAAWSTIGSTGEDQRTSDLSAIVQEVVSETSWNSGNAMAFIFTGTGTRTAEAYDSDQAGAPLLYLEYTKDVSNIPPVLTLNGANPLTLNLGDTFSDPGATALDESDGDITADIVTDSNVDTSVATTYTITYSVTDSDGNSASLSRTVIVRDNTIAPVLTVNGANPLTLNLGDTFSDPGATALDETDGDLTADIVTDSNVDTGVAATYTVTYSVIDFDGNSASLSRTVFVRDNTIAPVLTLNGTDPITLKLGDSFSDPGATALDETDGNITADIVTDSNVDTSVPATYTVTYSVTDSDGNSASLSRTVIVRHNTIAPVLTLLGANPVILNRGDIFTDPGATAIDNLDGNLTASIQTVSNVNTSVAGTYQVTCWVTDTDGNTASVIRNVIVLKNTIAPVIHLIGDNPLNINLGDSFIDPGATAVDDVDGELTESIQTTYATYVDTSVAGTYLVTYTVTDLDGNSASASRSVIISNSTDTIQSNVSENEGGGSTDRVLLLLLALAFLFKHQKKRNYEQLE